MRTLFGSAIADYDYSDRVARRPASFAIRMKERRKGRTGHDPCEAGNRRNELSDCLSKSFCRLLPRITTWKHVGSDALTLALLVVSAADARPPPRSSRLYRQRNQRKGEGHAC